MNARLVWLITTAIATTVCAQQVIILPPGSPIPAPGTYPPGTIITIGGTAVGVGTASQATVGTPNAIPQEIRSGFPGRSGGFGAAPQLNMRIQGDGVFLPRGVGESAKSKADTGKEQTRDKDKESAQEKAKGENSGDSKGKDVASTSPRNEKSQAVNEKDGKAGGSEPSEQDKPGVDKERTQGKGNESVQEKTKGEDLGGSKGPGIASTSPRLEKGQPADGKGGSAKDPAPDEGKDRDPATPRPIGRESLPPKAADGRPAISAPRDEKEQDPVARRIDQGLERNPGAARPTDLKVKGSGVEVPRCFGESREGEGCK